MVSVLVVAGQSHAARFAGRVTAADGSPVAGALVTFTRGDPLHATSVFSGDDGSFETPELRAEVYRVRARRIGLRDGRLEGVTLGDGEERSLALRLEPETDPAALAAQLPANRWLALALERIEDPARREEFLRQCTFCHQQGNPATRLTREEWQWHKILALMGRMGGIVSPELRAELPALLNAAYDPASAVPKLTERRGAADFAPPPPARVRRAVIEEWELGGRATMQHDLAVHPDGRVYSVDMLQDRLYRLDPASGEAEAFDIPRGDLPLGGVFATGGPLPSTSNAHVGPHSLQVAPDGSVWITLALGNQIARFEPRSAGWSIFPLADGLYPHTLRFDARGRLWYTVAVSNHVGRLDPATGEHRQVRVPAAGLGQALALRALPALLWLNRRFDLASRVSGAEGATLPIPYGIDVAPDGGVWFSQLNERRIGRIDPETLDVRMVETPFPGPRRLRFDSRGRLWIPGFSASLVARYDPESGRFDTFDLPIEPRGTETPYALHVDRRTDAVWICGTNSDTLIRFEPQGERFTVYPLPTRVTYTREIDFDAQGRVWTSNSNLPTWQIEEGVPRVLRLDPRDAGALAREGTP
jgi:streptogramin lyase